MPDQGPATRMSLARVRRECPALQAPALAEGTVPDPPVAQQGFAAPVEVRKGSRVRRLFDTGMFAGLSVPPGRRPVLVPARHPRHLRRGALKLGDLMGPLGNGTRARRQRLAQAEEQLARGWQGNTRQIRHAIAIALEFHTWQTLTHQRGLSRNQGIWLMLAMVEGVKHAH